MPNTFTLFLLVAVAIVAPDVAWAHAGDPNHTHSFVTGLRHPLAGVDHLFAMVAVGLWAGQSGSARRYFAPAAFVAGMALGLGFGDAFAVVWDVEVGVAASLIVIGLLVLLSLELPVWVAVGVLALAGALHGAAHVSEGPASPEFQVFAAGAVITTLVVQTSGALAALLLRPRGQVLLRVAGGVTSLAGAVLLAN